MINPMTPKNRRTIAVETVIFSVLFGGLAFAGILSWSTVFVGLVLSSLIVAFWPSNPDLVALEAARKQKALKE